MEHVLNLIALFSLALICLILVSVRRAHIRVEYSVSWLAAGTVLLVLSRSSAVLAWIASLLRLDSPLMALLAILAITFLIVFFRFTVIISQLRDSNIATMQRLAILEYQLRELNEEKHSSQSLR